MLVFRDLDSDTFGVCHDYSHWLVASKGHIHWNTEGRWSISERQVDGLVTKKTKLEKVSVFMVFSSVLAILCS